MLNYSVSTESFNNSAFAEIPMTTDDEKIDFSTIIPKSNSNKSLNARQSTYLTIRLLNEIKLSIRSFQPSKSLQVLTSLQSTISLDDSMTNLLTMDTQQPKQKKPTAEIDIVISGGGLKGYFMAGCSSILLSELKKNRVNISRISGASAGAWAAMFMLCGIDTDKWIETYHACRENPGKTLHETYEKIRWSIDESLPKNAYQICTNKLFISVTYLTIYGPKNRMISEFFSNEDLLQCCFASSTIPYLTERNGFRRFRGEWVCDGGLLNNCPVFTDGIRRQLVFRLFEVEYPYRMLVNAQGQYNILSKSLFILHFNSY